MRAREYGRATDEDCERSPGEYQRLLLAWSGENLRSFPWREPNYSAYAHLVTEMLLRKTRAQAVEPVVAEVLATYPSPTELAGSAEDDLVQALQSLGLQRIRSVALRQVSQILVAQYEGHVPREVDKLKRLPHVGRYIANAVACFAFGEARPIVDANVVRVLGRCFGLSVPQEVHKAEEFWALAAWLLPATEVRRFNWALLDLGALVCTPRIPDCSRCPWSDLCRAHEKSTCGCQQNS